MIDKKYTLITLALVIIAAIFIYIYINAYGGSNMKNESSTTKIYNDLIINTDASTEEETSSSANEDTTNTGEEETTSLSKKDAKKLIDFDAEFPFTIKINRAQNFAIAYGLDKDGRYSIPYKAFVCSVGLKKEDTPLGVFQMSDKYTWRMMVDYSYSQYAIRIDGPIMLHSVPYYYQTNNSLEIEEYNKLGSPASLGCIRFNVKSIKWIYDNCPKGASVVIYDAKKEVPPIKIPKVKKLDLDDERSNWDPTDPNSRNPWKK